MLKSAKTVKAFTGASGICYIVVILVSINMAPASLSLNDILCHVFLFVSLQLKPAIFTITVPITSFAKMF